MDEILRSTALFVVNYENALENQPCKTICAECRDQRILCWYFNPASLQVPFTLEFFAA